MGAQPMYETLLYDTDGPIAVITLNRSRTLNGIKPEGLPFV